MRHSRVASNPGKMGCWTARPALATCAMQLMVGSWEHLLPGTKLMALQAMGPSACQAVCIQAWPAGRALAMVLLAQAPSHMLVQASRRCCCQSMCCSSTCRRMGRRGGRRMGATPSHTTLNFNHKQGGRSRNRSSRRQPHGRAGNSKGPCRANRAPTAMCMPLARQAQHNTHRPCQASQPPSTQDHGLVVRQQCQGRVSHSHPVKPGQRMVKPSQT